MNQRQREMARHALGLTKGQRRSYRNRYFIGPGGDAHPLWMDLVDRGLAVQECGRPGPHRLDLFSLTREGAEMVLRKGERLDPEDFPPR